MKLKYFFESVDMGEEIIAVPVGENADMVNGVLKLNQSGKIIMNFLKNDITEEKIVDSLAENYTNDADNLQNYVHLVVNTLRDSGLIEE